MSSEEELLVSIEALRFGYLQAGAEAGLLLENIELKVPRAATAVVLGPADAGKTTLARIVAGTVPRFTGGAIAGSVRIAGQELLGVPPYERLESVGVVAQDSEEQLLTTRCDSEVAFALESLGVPQSQMRDRVMQSLQKVGLEGAAARNPATLSGGEKKRLLAACLAAIRPRLWVLDEALGELDFEWKGRTLDLAAESGATLLLLESRWSRLVEQRGTAYHLLDGGRLRASAHDAREPSLGAALEEAGIKPARQMPPEGPPREGCLRVQGLAFRFDEAGGFALRIDALELKFGETCALVGRNGSGKSTLGRLLCGLLRPQSGIFDLAGTTGSRRARPEELGSRIGYLFQNPDHQIFLPTVREELGLGLRGVDLPRPEVDRRVEEAAELFRLPDLEAPPALLSYGARRRLQAATYFLLDRDLLILDEVDTGLSFREVERLLGSLRKRTPGLVLITHDLMLARGLTHRLLVMESGRIAKDVKTGHLPSLGGPDGWDLP